MRRCPTNKLFFRETSKRASLLIENQLGTIPCTLKNRKYSLFPYFFSLFHLNDSKNILHMLSVSINKTFNLRRNEYTITKQ